MVGLQFKSGLVKEGESLYGQEKEAEGVAPWAAALSDVLLTSNCAACFVALNPSSARFACQGSCHGAVAYCSRACRDLDFSAHTLSGECSLLFLRSLADESSTVHSPFTLLSLEGTCDLRAALRLLAHHEACGHVTHFLAASGSHLRDDETPRLGGLLSNRSTLLQPTPSDEFERCLELEEEQTSIASALRAAALLMHRARLLEPCMCYTSKRNEMMEEVADKLTDSCVPGRGHRSLYRNAQECANAPTDVCSTTTGIAITKSCNNHETGRHLDSTVYTCRDVHAQKDAHMVINGLKGTQEMVDVNMDIHKDANKAMRGGQDIPCEATLANAATTSVVSSMTRAEELLLLEEVICQVFTNGVRIQVETWSLGGHSHAWLDDLGTAVYGPYLSWINHSCRPNAFYSFVIGGSTTVKGPVNVPLVPDKDVKALEDAWGLKSCCFPSFEGGDFQGLRHYGPRVCLRSIRNIKGQEPVYISYVDLLQPKSTRRQELWMKYCFNCMCERCDVNSTNDVDAVLQNECCPGILTTEDFFHSEVQRGIDEFLEADNPSSCCKIMEDTLIRVLYEGYRSWLGGHTLSEQSTRLEVNNDGEISVMQHGLYAGVCETCEVQVDFQLMHHRCLDVYTTLSSSYNVCASDFSMGNDIEGTKELECKLASALYTLILAATIQYMYDYGEPGLLGIAARAWLQTGELFVTLILKLDSYFCVGDTFKLEKVFSSMAFSREGEFVDEQKRVLNTHGRLSDAIRRLSSTSDLLRCIFTSLWPVLRNASPFLSYVETPFDVNKISFVPLKMRMHILDSRDVWIQHRSEAFVGALCALHHGLRLSSICYGFNQRRIVALVDFLSSKTSCA